MRNKREFFVKFNLKKGKAIKLLNFLVIGAQRTGSNWIYEQLKSIQKFLWGIIGKKLAIVSL
ncbi:MAG: hypothetical protein ABIN61_02375 [candidate division WOR-3 bacterium]